ncbi:Gfo/Idh/MocA family oxidoreductase [Streptomyces sp. SL13]|uniref:Gfo/Idh/MocA family oxidoreductase n=1 Tax=Streptantibioticus silvisoli TaxID=2705255 RepID=A0AA90H5T5_9ACTN|nr:Gfo/Idh/MocA family oxidoreductase [Streptantibioticus silvisoli]MDI5965008.1 Gfo/Idh/MocA family oxidoreductase [Streptantibioticus silvisoli]MDI5974079.1 Gfo/Idh/MocA family oxidoreductase [Streptantibioticus silvisoli]
MNTASAVPSDQAGPATVRIVLVGCGAIGWEVASRVYAQPTGGRYRLVAAVDPHADRAGAVGDLLGVPAFASLAEVLAAGVAFDAVDQRLPHHLHADAAVEVLAAGRHVLVEKPLATSAADAVRMVAASQDSGAVAAVAENYPHLSAVRAARHAIAAGRAGTVRALRTTRAYTLGGAWLRDGWRTGAGPSSGIMLDQGTHHTSLLRRLGGRISAVAAQHSTAPEDAGDGAVETVLLTVRFASGLVGHCVYSWGAAALADEAEATVFGSKARIDVRVSYEADLGHARLFDPGTPQGTAISAPENYYDSHRLMVDDWVAAITERRRPLVTFADAAADLAVVLAAAASLRHGGGFVDVAEIVGG